MPAPTPEIALLNRFFETRRNPPRVPPLTSGERDALDTFHFGLQQSKGTRTSSTTSTPSTSTLALEEDDIKDIFMSDKIDTESLGEDLRTPRPSANATNRGNLGLMPSRPMHNRRFSVDDLNPNAEPFVPTFPPNLPAPPAPAPRATSWRLLRPRLEEKLPTLITRWLRTFRRAMGTTTSAMSDYDVLSMIVINSERWDPPEMVELVQEFLWYGPEVEQAMVAAFAQEVYKKFQDMRGEEYAESFLWHLKEAVLGTYMSVWDANNNPEAISYRWVPSLEYIRAAIALGAFIGNLFTRDMITCANVTTCLNMVMQNLVAFEHVEAIKVLIGHAGPTYWLYNGEGPGGIRRFQALLVCRADRLRDEMSVVGRTLGPGEVKKAVGGMMMKCDMWLEQLVVTPRKSLCT